MSPTGTRKRRQRRWPPMNLGICLAILMNTVLPMSVPIGVLAIRDRLWTTTRVRYLPVTYLGSAATTIRFQWGDEMQNNIQALIDLLSRNADRPDGRLALSYVVSGGGPGERYEQVLHITGLGESF